jgi:hypothetical protein
VEKLLESESLMGKLNRVTDDKSRAGFAKSQVGLAIQLKLQVITTKKRRILNDRGDNRFSTLSLLVACWAITTHRQD